MAATGAPAGVASAGALDDLRCREGWIAELWAFSRARIELRDLLLSGSTGPPLPRNSAMALGSGVVLYSPRYVSCDVLASDTFDREVSVPAASALRILGT